jgi:hypothetical protein
MKYIKKFDFKKNEILKYKEIRLDFLKNNENKLLNFIINNLNSK